MSTEEEYTRLLNEFPGKFHAVLNWNKYLQRLVQVGRRTGRTDMEIGDDIRNTLRGQVDDRTIRLYLPPSMKHEEKVRDLRQRFPQNMQELKPKLQDPAHDHIVEIIPEPEPAKAIPTPNNRIRLDTAKFRSDLRIALINGDKIWLTYNSANEVIEITER